MDIFVSTLIGYHMASDRSRLLVLPYIKFYCSLVDFLRAAHPKKPYVPESMTDCLCTLFPKSYIYMNIGSQYVVEVPPRSS